MAIAGIVVEVGEAEVAGTTLEGGQGQLEREGRAGSDIHRDGRRGGRDGGGNERRPGRRGRDGRSGRRSRRDEERLSRRRCPPSGTSTSGSGCRRRRAPVRAHLRVRNDFLTLFEAALREELDVGLVTNLGDSSREVGGERVGESEEGRGEEGGGKLHVEEKRGRRIMKEMKEGRRASTVLVVDGVARSTVDAAREMKSTARASTAKNSCERNEPSLRTRVEPGRSRPDGGLARAALEASTGWLPPSDGGVVREENERDSRERSALTE